jgi:hypothetical protein
MVHRLRIVGGGKGLVVILINEGFQPAAKQPEVRRVAIDAIRVDRSVGIRSHHVEEFRAC